MIKKRLVGVVTVKNGWAVQSFGYRRYLPLGRPEVLIENLDRWGADEILLQCIDRSRAGLGPDFDLLERIGKSGLSTPLIYAGGIRHADDAREAVQKAADRVAIDALLHDRPTEARAIAEQLGAQAVIATLPVSIEDGVLHRLDYRTGRSAPLDAALKAVLASGMISETLVVDWRNEGNPGAFDLALLEHGAEIGMPLIVFGGLSETGSLSQALASPQVVAAGIGNFLSYREHAVQRYKQALATLPLRPADFQRAG